jgi:hypothetical protein
MNNYSTPLVVLYSTSYRTWETEEVLNSQIELIDRLSQLFCERFGMDPSVKPILGIHYWNAERGHKQLNQDFHFFDSPLTSPTNPPGKISKYSYTHTKSDQLELDQERSTHLFYTSISTKFALESANSLHKNMFGTNIPDNQPILRLRPDCILNYTKIDFLKNIDINSHFFISNRSNNHRPHISENAPEVSDIMWVTNNKSMDLLLSTPIERYFDIYDYYKSNGRIVEFEEQYLYNLLDYCKIDIYNDPNIEISLLRTSGSINNCASIKEGSVIKIN